MASNSKLLGSKQPSYTDFEPGSEWKREELVDTWIIELPEFKKEELRVQVNKGGILKVVGERSTNAPGTTKRRFAKETKVPEGCDMNEIRAQLMNNQLHITMPKKPKAPQSLDNPVFEVEGKLKANKNVILWFGIVAVTMVAIGAFVGSKYGSDYLCSHLYMDD